MRFYDLLADKELSVELVVLYLGVNVAVSIVSTLIDQQDVSKTLTFCGLGATPSSSPRQVPGRYWQ
jgi:hypothetical protein